MCVSTTLAQRLTKSLSGSSTSRFWCTDLRSVINVGRCFPSAGEDPLAERKCDLDSVAGVLKLYFRSLESPLVPIESTSQLLEHARTFASV